MNKIAPASGISFLLKKGEILEVIDIEGGQVSDLFCVSSKDVNEFLSCARSLDYSDSLFISEGDFLYSNRSQVMLEIIQDSCGRHDLLMPPCSLKMYQIVADDPEFEHRSCHENLYQSLQPYGVTADHVMNSFNIFMRVDISPNGFLKIQPPLSRRGDRIRLQAHMDLHVGLTACAHEETNGGQLKPVGYIIHKMGDAELKSSPEV